MIKLFSIQEPTQATMAIVTCGATTVVENLMQIARAGLNAYDWHIWNVAFDDDDREPKCKGFKLIDWAGNHTANAPLSLRDRMHKAFKQFSDCFKDFQKWGSDRQGEIQLAQIYEVTASYIERLVESVGIERDRTGW